MLETKLHRTVVFIAALIGIGGGVVLGAPGVASADDYCRTRHPIVLAHGMSGFDDIFGVIEYWHRIPAELRACGARVYVTTVPQFSTTALRGEALLEQVEEIVAIAGTGKVNIIGHSHGGLDARYVASARPDLVASVTTVGSPNKGAELADFLRENIRGGSFTEGAVAFFANSLGSILSLLTGTRHAQDSVGALDDLSTAGMARFNAEHPQGVPAARCGEGAGVVRGPAVIPTPMAPARATNRGAFGQYASVCLAENLGYETGDILRFFFGDDIGFSRPLVPVSDEGM